MNKYSYISHLTCSHCDDKFDHNEIQSYCAKCNKPLLAEYDLESVKQSLSKANLKNRNPDLWRYHELLPVMNSENVISFGEGYTPLLPFKNVGSKIGYEHISMKDEGQLPTGSFKSRGLAMAVSKALELGVKRVAIPTAGNAGGALAAYAVKAGMECFVFMPKDVPSINYMETKLTGAEVTLVDGLISDCGKIVRERQDEMGWFDVSTLKEPYRLEGKKTMGFELAEQLNWTLPDVIIYPTGGGTGLIAMWKAFAELREVGWITGKLPKMVSVQSTGCDPITKAYLQGAATSEFYKNAETLASGLRVPKAFGDALILTALRESGGTAVSVSDQDILSAMRELAELEGLVVCPEGAATLVAAKKLLQSGDVSPEDKLVLFNTGSGLKYPEVLTQLTQN